MTIKLFFFFFLFGLVSLCKRCSRYGVIICTDNKHLSWEFIDGNSVFSLGVSCPSWNKNAPQLPLENKCNPDNENFPKFPGQAYASGCCVVVWVLATSSWQCVLWITKNLSVPRPRTGADYKGLLVKTRLSQHFIMSLRIIYTLHT